MGLENAFLYNFLLILHMLKSQCKISHFTDLPARLMKILSIK